MKYISNLLFLSLAIDQSLEFLAEKRLISIIKTVLPSVARINFYCSFKSHKLMLNNLEHGKTVGYSKQVTRDESVVFCADHHEPEVFKTMLKSHPLNAVKNVWVVFGSTDRVLDILKIAEININKRVYFLHSDIGALEEIYEINNHTVTTPVGKIVETADNSTKLEWTNQEIFWRRRANFKGKVFETKVHSTSKPYVYFPHSILQRANWSKDKNGNLVHDVTHEQAKGIFADVMSSLETDLNFTTTRIIRQDNNVGFPVKRNGTVVGFTGITRELMSGDIDLMMVPLQHTIERYGMHDFLHSVATFTINLVVSAEAGNEDQEWLTYYLPFMPNLWLFLLANGFLAALSLEAIHFLNFGKPGREQMLSSIFRAVENFKMVLMSYFARGSSRHDAAMSIQIFLFIVFLSGNLVFIAYRASLTTELLVTRKTLPFSSPQGLYESKYSVIHTYSFIDAQLKLYRNYPNMYWIAKSYYTQDHSNSFYRFYEDAIEALTEPYSHKALFNFAEKLYASPEYKCRVSQAWKRSSPGQMTMTLRKHFPYTEILNEALLEKMNFGLVSRISRRHSGSKDLTCPTSLSRKSVGMYKMIGPFMVYFLAICISIGILLGEMCWAKYLLKKVEDVELHVYKSGFGRKISWMSQKWCGAFGDNPELSHGIFEIELQLLLDSIEKGIT